jgi:hypothetical protein
MSDDLSRRIDAIAQRSYEAQRQAEYTFAKAMEARNSVLGGLFRVATEIERKNGATLAGHKFRFVGPDTKPKLDPAIDVFVARVFEASFEGCPGNSSFGLHFEIDHYQHVTACYLGAAALVDTRDIVGQFVAWLEEFWFCFPTEEVTAAPGSEAVALFEVP